MSFSRQADFDHFGVISFCQKSDEAYVYLCEHSDKITGFVPHKINRNRDIRKEFGCRINAK